MPLINTQPTSWKGKDLPNVLTRLFSVENGHTLAVGAWSEDSAAMGVGDKGRRIWRGQCAETRFTGRPGAVKPQRPAVGRPRA